MPVGRARDLLDRALGVGAGVVAVVALAAPGMVGGPRPDPDLGALPTSGRAAGAGGEDGVLEGALGATDDGCLTVRQGPRDGSAAAVLVVWPRGFFSVVGPDGAVEVRDDRADVVAVEGVSVSLPGGFGELPRHRCSAGADAAFWVAAS